MIMKALMKNMGILGITLVSLSACRNDHTQQTKDSVSVVETKIDTLDTNVEAKTTLTYPEPDFPTGGTQIEALVPTNFNIDMEVSGDLNKDGLEDKVLVLINTRDTTARRPTLVILKVGDAYHVDARSLVVVEPKYREDGYLNYDFEEVQIDKNGQLIFSQQSTGPNGSLESILKYLNNELVLTNISSFAMGAGGQTELKLDLKKGIFEQTDINTMKEDMPSKTTTQQYKLPKTLFANSDPRAIMIKAFKDKGK